MAKRGNREGTISKRKNGTWCGAITLGYDANGKQLRKFVYGKTRQEVAQKLHALKHQVQQKTYTSSIQTIAEFLEEWLTYKCRSIRPRTAEAYTRSVRHLSLTLGRSKLADLSPQEIRTAVGDIADRVGVRSANQCRAVLLNALNDALDLELIHRNPVNAIKPFTESPRKPVNWSAADKQRMLSVVQAHRLRALFYLAFATGLRQSELLGLRWDNLSANVLKVTQQLGRDGQLVALKTRSSERRLGLPDDVLDSLQAHRNAQVQELEVLGVEIPIYNRTYASHSKRVESAHGRNETRLLPVPVGKSDQLYADELC